MKRGHTVRHKYSTQNELKDSRAYCDNHMIEPATYFCTPKFEYWCTKCFKENSSDGKLNDENGFIENKINTYFFMWNDLKQEIMKVSSCQ